MTNPLISVIVPVYNSEKYLKNCISSIRNQTYDNLEIILVDDGSPDNCPAICDEWEKKDNRIKVIHKKNEGVSSARNAGLDAATGEFIGFVDGDDIIAPNFYEILVAQAEEHKADISACYFTHYNDDYSIYKDSECYIESQKTYTPNELLHEYFESCKGEWVSFCNKIIRSSLFSGLRFPNGRVFEDWTLAPIIYSRATRICFIPEPLYGYVIHSGSAVRTLNIKIFYDCVLADYDHFRYFNSIGVTDYNENIRGFAKSDFRKCIKVYDKSDKSKKMLKEAYEKCIDIGGVSKVEKLMFKFPLVFKTLYRLKG